ncbi:MAG: CRISPR-associated endonuclease Cas2 [Campylobacterales bacterium]
MSNYMVCYDISDEKRLRKVARNLEGRALRIQFSVFLAMDIKSSELYEEFEQTLQKIDINSDDFRIYKIKDRGLRMGKGVDIDEVFII